MIKLFKQWSSRKEIEELNSLKSKIYITQRWCAEFEQMYDVLKHIISNDESIRDFRRRMAQKYREGK